MRKYTKQEDKIIINCIKMNVFNLQEAFASASAMLGRSKASVCQRYYGTIRHNTIVFELKGDTTYSNMKMVKTKLGG